MPSSELIQEVQTAIDPVQNHGEGLGLAPIGHVVTVEGITETVINIETEITYDEGWSWEDIESTTNDVIDSYFNELSKSWADNSNIIVRISQIETRLLDIEGVIDIQNTKLNSQTKNITLEENSIPKRGTVSA